MRGSTKSARGWASVRLLAAALVAAGCAHADDREAGGPSDALAADHAHGGGDQYHSATDEDRAPVGAADNPYAQRYGDLDVEETIRGRISLFTPDLLDLPTPAEPEDRYVAVSPTLPAGSVVRVRRLDDGREVIVQVRRTEELPYGDLAISQIAGRRLGLLDRGVLHADLEVLLVPEERVR